LNQWLAFFRSGFLNPLTAVRFGAGFEMSAGAQAFPLVVGIRLRLG
jgi:hypothetical protein